jgi:hypothetical protein
VHQVFEQAVSGLKGLRLEREAGQDEEQGDAGSNEQVGPHRGEGARVQETVDTTGEIVPLAAKGHR